MSSLKFISLLFLHLGHYDGNVKQLLCMNAVILGYSEFNCHKGELKLKYLVGEILLDITETGQ